MGLRLACKTLILIATLALAVSLCASQATEPPEISVPHCTVSPIVDGELADPCWHRVKPLGEFYLYKGDGEMRDIQDVRVVHDDAWLYAAFRIEREHTDVMESTVADHDGNVSATDSVELFLDPGTSGELYFHYMLSIDNDRDYDNHSSVGRRTR